MVLVQIREPYSAVRFLAEHVELEKILDLKPRTQHFDGIEEELVTLCIHTISHHQRCN